MTFLNLLFQIIHSFEYFIVLFAILDCKLLDSNSVSFFAISYSRIYVTDIQDLSEQQSKPGRVSSHSVLRKN